jgi:macrolide-specific efflux system membrane fusion protein
VKENELATIQHRLELHRIKSPIAGVVVEVKRRRGEWVEPGTPVARIMLLDRLRVEAFCYFKDLQTVQVDRPVRLRVVGDGAPAVEYEGRITFVSPEVNPVNGQVRIWAEVKNADGALRPGMSGSLIVAAVETAAAVGSPARP